MAGDLSEIVEKLQDTHEVIARLERTIAEQGDPPPSILMTLSSLKKRRTNLEAQLQECQKKRNTHAAPQT